MTLYELFQSYGWQLALVGLFGTVLIELIKSPIKKLVVKKAINSAESTFDTVAFLLGFAVAALLGCAYTAFASAFGWLYNEDGTVLIAGLAVYCSNSVGTWLYQIVYYQIWKKLGLKRLCSLIAQKIRNRLDTNKDGDVDFNEAVRAIQSLIKNGKIDVNQVLSTVVETAPEVVIEAVNDIQREAGEAAVVDVSANTKKLQTSADTMTAKVLKGKSAAAAKAASAVAAEAVEDIAEAPVEVADSAKPTRPSVKF